MSGEGIAIEPELVLLAPRPVVVDQDGYELVVRTANMNSKSTMHRPDLEAFPEPRPACAHQRGDDSTYLWRRRKFLGRTWDDCPWAYCFGDRTRSSFTTSDQRKTYYDIADDDLSSDEKWEMLQNGEFQEGES